MECKHTETHIITLRGAHTLKQWQFPKPSFVTTRHGWHHSWWHHPQSLMHSPWLYFVHIPHLSYSSFLLPSISTAQSLLSSLIPLPLITSAVLLHLELSLMKGRCVCMNTLRRRFVLTDYIFGTEGSLTHTRTHTHSCTHTHTHQHTNPSLLYSANSNSKKLLFYFYFSLDILIS